MIRVVNLDNLFWDNGTYKVPNTFPKLLKGKTLEKTTPVMTTPLTGWIVLEGDYNYAEYKDNLFFLKKDKLISETNNKWRYILIKDQLCSIYKNKANVIAKGTVINTDLKHLNNENYQFTLPAFNLLANRILVPLEKDDYDWKRDLHRILISSELTLGKTVGDEEFTAFIQQLTANKDLLTDLTYSLQNNKYFCLLGRAERRSEPTNWKDELRRKINDLLNNLKDSDISMGHIENRTYARIVNCYTIGPTEVGLNARKVENKTLKEIDLSKLQDIKQIDIASLAGEEWTVEEKLFSIGLEYNEELLRDGIDEIPTYIKKLTRRVRLPFSNPYSTRAIFHSTKHDVDVKKGGRNYFPWYWSDQKNKELYYPQKLFFYIEKEKVLVAKDEYSVHFPKDRIKEGSYRSVYLYYVYNWDFLFSFANKENVKEEKEIVIPDYKAGLNFIDPEKYFKGEKAKVYKDLSGGIFLRGTEETKDRRSKVKPVRVRKGTQGYYPWWVSDKWLEKHLNIGWLIGQFTQFQESNAKKFHKDHPFLITNTTSELWRITGLKEPVKELIQNEDAYKNTEGDNKYQLDIFNTLPPRARHNTKEEDFLIGEKLIFWTWGLGAYLLFQPLSEVSGDEAYSYNYQVPLLIGNYLLDASYHYGYELFDKSDSYLTSKAKTLFKKAYENFNPLDYNQQFYWSVEGHKPLEKHILENTKHFFKLDKVTLATDTPFKEPFQEGDIFYSDLEWYYFDQGGALETGRLQDKQTQDFLIHAKDGTVILEEGDIVVYCEPTSQKLFLGKVQIWNSEIKLPAGQYILPDGQISADHSTYDTLTVKYTRVKKIRGKEDKYASGFPNFDALISTLKEDSAEIFEGLTDFSLTKLRHKNPSKYFLFDLVGTDFYCLLDRQDRVTLIVKQEATKRLVVDPPRKVYKIKPNKAIETLDNIQKVNQRVVLSIYGEKIDLPVKAIKDNRATELVTINIQEGSVPGQSPAEVFEPCKVEVKHALGTVYYRFDRERESISVAELAKLDAFQIQQINIQQRRNSENYLIDRERFEISLGEMQLAHDQQRLEWAQNHTNAWLNLITGAVGTIAGVIGGVATGGIGTAISAGVGAGALGSFFKGVTNLGFGYARKGFIERGIALDIERKNIESYTIDLNFARQKQDHRLLLKRAFSQISFTKATSRQRSKALDQYELELQGLEDKEIYLEVWTASREQLPYLKDFHEKHGVDCRIPLRSSLEKGSSFEGISIKNGLEEGIWTLEDVEILNLKDRIDVMFLKTRLEVGIKIVNWVEHEGVGEIIPVDPRITKLQQALKISGRLQIQLEQDKVIQKQQIEELKAHLEEEERKLIEVNTGLEAKKAELQRISASLQAKEQQLLIEQGKYSSLTKSYERKEEEITTQKNLVTLYRQEADTLRTTNNDLRAKNRGLEDQIKSNETLLESTRGELSQMTREKERVAQQYEQIQEQIRGLDQAYARRESRITELEDLLSKSQQVVQQKIKDYQNKDLELQQCKQEKDSLTLQGEKKQAEVQRLEAFIATLRKEAEEVKKPITQLDSKYAIINCTRNQNLYGRMLVVEFRPQKQAWIRTRNEIFYNPETKQVKMIVGVANQDKAREEMALGFTKKMSGYREYQELVEMMPMEPLTIDSFQVSKGLPFFESEPRDGNAKLGCERWYREDKGWSHSNRGGDRKITTYREYLEVLGMELNEKGFPVQHSRIKLLEQQIQEKENSLRAVREIESNLNVQLTKCKENVKYITEIFKQFFTKQTQNVSEEWMDQTSQYLAVVVKQEEKFVVAQVSFVKVKDYWIPYLFVVNEEQEFRKYDYYGMFGLGTANLRTTYITEGYTNTYYFSDSIKTWEDIKRTILNTNRKKSAIPMDSKYHFLFSEMAFPIFERIVQDYQHLKEGFSDYEMQTLKPQRPTYWDDSKKWFTYTASWHTDQIYNLHTYAVKLLGFDPLKSEFK